MKTLLTDTNGSENTTATQNTMTSEEVKTKPNSSTGTNNVRIE